MTVLEAMARALHLRDQRIDAAAKGFSGFIPALWEYLTDDQRQVYIDGVCELLNSPAEPPPPADADDIVKIIREWLDRDDPTHWGKFEKALNEALDLAGP